MMPTFVPPAFSIAGYTLVNVNPLYTTKEAEHHHPLESKVLIIFKTKTTKILVAKVLTKS
jgi:hypothetical protein